MPPPKCYRNSTCEMISNIYDVAAVDLLRHGIVIRWRTDRTTTTSVLFQYAIPLSENDYVICSKLLLCRPC